MRYLGDLKPQAMCFSCHGALQQIPAGVSVLMNERYRRDRAMGCQADELRSGLSVTLAVGVSIQ